MSVPVLTFFNNKGGVGKTSLVYHLSWMFSMGGERIVAVDLDPQANLTSAFIDEDALEALWNDETHPNTIFRAVKPLTAGGDILSPKLVRISERLHLVPGDVALAGFEETLSEEWPHSMGDANLYRPFRILSGFWQVMQDAAKQAHATLILADVGPNLGAINRSALIATDFVVIPLGADLFSLQGLKNLGPTLRSWRSLWKNRLENWKRPEFDLPKGRMEPLGYIVQQHSVRLSRPVKAYDQWINRIPGVYRQYVLEEPPLDLRPADDVHCLATVKHYRSLIPMAQEARKPIFELQPADGAIGSHADAVTAAGEDFRRMEQRIREAMQGVSQSSIAKKQRPRRS